MQRKQEQEPAREQEPEQEHDPSKVAVEINIPLIIKTLSEFPNYRRGHPRCIFRRKITSMETLTIDLGHVAQNSATPVQQYATLDRNWSPGRNGRNAV